VSGERAVDIHLLDVDAEADAGGFASLLDKTETARANRFLDALAQRRYVIRHGWMRRVLARYVGAEAAALEFSTNAHGKPQLAHGPHFSLSRSHSYALLAVGELEMGCDIERRDPGLDHAGLAGRFFTAREAASLATLPEHAGLVGFFACWTCKEAFVKAKGLGLQLPLYSFEVDLARPDKPSLGAGAEGWRAHAFEATPGYQAVVVAPEALRGLRPAGRL
jgi:4'-phosphopantetheinyl transferase